MASSLQVGQSLIGRHGASYHLQKVLYERKEIGKDITQRLWLALSDSRPYVLKAVSPFNYEQAFRLKDDLRSSPFVRLPVDSNDSTRILIFPYFTEDFLSFMQSGPVSRPQVKRILQDILKGIAAFHTKDWVHGDIKPNNIMISFTVREDGTRDISNVSLSDVETAAKVKEGEGIFIQVGNVFWRSPEAQAGTRVGKSSDIWSFGATVVYGITKMVIFAYDELEDGVSPEVEVVSNMLSYFGPLPRGLREHLHDSPWCQVLTMIDQSFDQNTPRKPFILWKNIEGICPGDKEFIGRILNLDPKLRPSASELLNDEWFSSA